MDPAESTVTGTERADVVEELAQPTRRPGIVESVGKLRLRLSVELGVVRLTLGDLLRLERGCRLSVDRAGRLDLPVSVQGRPLLCGALLDRDSRLAVRLVPGASE